MADSRKFTTVAMAIDDTDMLIILRFAAICILFNCSTTLHLLQRIKDCDERLFSSVFLGQISTASRSDDQGDGFGNQRESSGDESSDNSGHYDFYK